MLITTNLVFGILLCISIYCTFHKTKEKKTLYSTDVTRQQKETSSPQKQIQPIQGFGSGSYILYYITNLDYSEHNLVLPSGNWARFRVWHRKNAVVVETSEIYGTVDNSTTLGDLAFYAKYLIHLEEKYKPSTAIKR